MKTRIRNIFMTVCLVLASVTALASISLHSRGLPEPALPAIKVITAISSPPRRLLSPPSLSRYITINSLPE